MVGTMTWHVTSPLHFEIVEQPAPGMVRVLTQWEGVDELRHLAPDMATAQSWFASHRYSNARFEVVGDEANPIRSEEHTSELQSLMRISSAVFCLKKKNKTHIYPQVGTQI